MGSLVSPGRIEVVGGLSAPGGTEFVNWKLERFLGFPQITQDAGSRVLLSVTPLHWFRVRRIVIVSTQSNRILVRQMSIQGVAQFASYDGVGPRSGVFGRLGKACADCSLWLDVCPPSGRIELDVVNITAVAATYQFVLLGEVGFGL